MSARIVVVGGGTAGTLAANRLRRRFPSERASITVIDANDRHLYKPGLLFVPFGLARPSRLVRSRGAQLASGVVFLERSVVQVDLDSGHVLCDDGSAVGYDVLVLASGVRLAPEETPGLTGDGWSRSAHSFYDLEGSARLAAALASFEGGRLVVATMDMPIACPVAPLEFCFLADWHLRTRGLRAKVELVYLTPLDGAFTKATCNRELEGLLADKGVEVVTDFTTAEVDRARRRIVSYDGREVAYDLAVVVPLHEGAAYVSASDGLGDALGFVPTDPATLQSRARPNVFVIGDTADLPAPKAASVAHFEGAVLEANIVAFLEERPLPARFDGHASCFIESGFHKALLIDYNYDLEPVPGHFPARVGLPLLRQSHLNHLGKRAFEQLYWHVLLPGRELPGLRSDMPESGKRRDLIAA